MRIGRNIAEGLKHHVAGIIGPNDQARIQYAHEPGFSAAMRGIQAAVWVAAGDEERIRLADPTLLPFRETQVRAGPSEAVLGLVFLFSHSRT